MDAVAWVLIYVMTANEDTRKPWIGKDAETHNKYRTTETAFPKTLVHQLLRAILKKQKKPQSKRQHGLLEEL